jgi:hypothetical protein
MLYGYSTGALALGDFAQALEMMAPHRLEAVELSALRTGELPHLIESLSTLDLKSYRHISIHAPSKYSTDEERALAETLTLACSRFASIDGVVLHAEAIVDPAVWQQLGPRLFIENADRRKRTGRTAAEMIAVLRDFPDARVCLDLAHVQQVDPTLLEARRMLEAFRDRIGQIHFSQLDHACRHERLSVGYVEELHRLASIVPNTVVILESNVPATEITRQVQLAQVCFRRDNARQNTQLNVHA